MITIDTLSDLLGAFVDSQNKVLDALYIKHPTTIGTMYEGLSKDVLQSALFKGIDLRIITNSFIKGCDTEFDVMIVEGEEGMEELTGYLRNHRFMEFSWNMMNVLKEHKAKQFYDMLVYNFLLGKPWNVLEEAYWALCVEMVGEIETARQLLWKIASEHSNDPGLAITYCNFLGRHGEYHEEQAMQKERVLNEFVLTEEQKGLFQS